MIQEIKNECGDRLGINSFLMLPIQHLPRYGILLAEMTKELLKSIDVMKNEVAAFCVAEKNVQRMLTIVNESMSISDIKNSLVSNGTKLNIYYHTIIDNFNLRFRSTSKIKDSSWRWTSLTFSTGARSEDIEEKFFYLKSASSTPRMLTQNKCNFEELSTRRRWRLITSKEEIDSSWRGWKSCWLKSSSLQTLRRHSNGINWYQLYWRMRIKFIALIVSFRMRFRFSCDI